MRLWNFATFARYLYKRNVSVYLVKRQLTCVVRTQNPPSAALKRDTTGPYRFPPIIEKKKHQPIYRPTLSSRSHWTTLPSLQSLRTKLERGEGAICSFIRFDPKGRERVMEREMERKSEHAPCARDDLLLAFTRWLQQCDSLYLLLLVDKSSLWLHDNKRRYTSHDPHLQVIFPLIQSLSGLPVHLLWDLQLLEVIKDRFVSTRAPFKSVSVCSNSDPAIVVTLAFVHSDQMYHVYCHICLFMVCFVLSLVS